LDAFGECTNGSSLGRLECLADAVLDDDLFLGGEVDPPERRLRRLASETWA